VELDATLAFRTLALGTLAGVPLFALRTRGRTYAIFALVTLGFAMPGALATQALLTGWIPGAWAGAVDAAFLWGALATVAHFVHLVRARLRSRTWRALVSIPAQTFVAASFLAGLFQLALLPLRGLLWLGDASAALAALRWLDPLPYALALLSVATSARPRREWVRIRLDEASLASGSLRAPFGRLPDDEASLASGSLCAPVLAGARPSLASGSLRAPFGRLRGRGLERAPCERHRRRPPPPASGRVLRIVQISDPHLGPWQSVRRMQRRIARLLASEPDLVLLTGDFLTMEGSGSPGALAEALAPLRGAAGRCHAVFGNHDHEAPDEVRAALEANGVRLLVDEEALAATPAGPVQILGADWAARDRRARLRALVERHPRRADCLRLLLLHDPSAFHDLPDGAADLVLSGHTHGGQIGLVSLGLDWTVLSRSRWPDHGLFARGATRLYVHRGTGFYGFPLRLGVPGEVSVLELVLP
jgi:predicted MPP superfamily phosphohydrolase